MSTARVDLTCASCGAPNLAPGRPPVSMVDGTPLCSACEVRHR